MSSCKRQCSCLTQSDVLSPVGVSSGDCFKSPFFAEISQQVSWQVSRLCVCPPLPHLRWTCGSVQTSAVGDSRKLGWTGFSGGCSRKCNRNNKHSVSFQHQGRSGSSSNTACILGSEIFFCLLKDLSAIDLCGLYLIAFVFLASVPPWLDYELFSFMK